VQHSEKTVRFSLLQHLLSVLVNAGRGEEATRRQYFCATKWTWHEATFEKVPRKQMCSSVGLLAYIKCFITR